MSIQKEENSKPFEPQIKQKGGQGQNRQNFGDKDRSRTSNNDRQRQILDPIIGDNHKTDNMGTIIEGETTNVKIIVEMTVETEEDKILEVIILEAEVQHREVTEDIIAETQI